MKQKKTDDINCVTTNMKPKVKHDELYGRNIDDENSENDRDNTIRVHTYKINNYSLVNKFWEKAKKIFRKFI